MTRFSFKGPFYSPKSHESRSQGPVTHSEFICPPTDCKGFIIIGNPSSSPLISILNISRDPTTILFCVSKIIVDAIKGISWRALSHITKKYLVGMPLRAYGNTPIYVCSFIRRNRRSITSSSHPQPGFPGRRSTLPMGSCSIPTFLRSETSTARCVSGFKMICKHGLALSTYTLTKCLPVFGIFKNDKAAKSFSLFYHGDRLTRDRVICQPMEV